jgi:hypothetical protein
MHNTPKHWLIVRYSKKLENRTFRRLDMFPSSGEGEVEI